MESKKVIPILGIALVGAWWLISPKKANAKDKINIDNNKDNKQETKDENEKEKETEDKLQDTLNNNILVSKFLFAFGYIDNKDICLNEKNEWIESKACNDALLNFKKDYNIILEYLNFGEDKDENMYFLEENSKIDKDLVYIINYIISKLEKDGIKCIGFDEEGNKNCALIWEDVLNDAHKYLGSGFEWQWDKFDTFSDQISIAQTLGTLGYTENWKELLDENWKILMNENTAFVIRNFQEDYNEIGNLKITGVLDNYTINALDHTLNLIIEKLGDPYQDFKTCFPVAEDLDYEPDPEIKALCVKSWIEIING